MSDKPALSVVEIRDGAPSLQDMAGWLRRMADQLDDPECKADVRTVLLLSVDLDNGIGLSCFGDNPSRPEVVGLLEMAKQKAVTGSWD